MKRLLLALIVMALVVGVLAAPAGADPAEKTEYTRTECVYATGAPDVREVGKDGKILHIRSFPYIGFLSDDGRPIGVNSGFAAIDLNRENGSGSIRGNLTIRDEAMGDFDGRFSGHYQDFAWEGRGSAIGVDGDSGKLFKARLEGLDPEAACEPLGGVQPASDAALWHVVIIDPLD